MAAKIDLWEKDKTSYDSGKLVEEMFKYGAAMAVAEALKKVALEAGSDSDPVDEFLGTVEGFLVNP